MKKFLLTMVAAAFCSTGFAATGEVVTVLTQTFGKDTKLMNTDAYTWGDEIEGMISTAAGDSKKPYNKYGIFVTNNNDAENNYDARDFVTFTNTLGNDTQELNISYLVECPQDQNNNNGYFEVNFYNEKDEFVFGIKEGNLKGWKFSSDLIYVNEGGDKETVAFPTAHMEKAGGTTVNINLTFNAKEVIIDVDGVKATAYSAYVGIKSIKFAVTGEKDWSRPMVIGNLTVATKEVEKAQYADYTLKYVCDEQIIKSETQKGVVGDQITLSDLDKQTFFNDAKTAKYFYESDDSANKTIAADGSTVVTITYRQAAEYNYTVKSNVDDKVIASGKCLEGENVTIPYSRYILAEDGTVWMKDATNKEYHYSFIPTADNFVAPISYTKTEIADGIFFAEAEKMDGITEVTGSNANVRCSNAAGGYYNSEDAFEVYTLKPGTYKVAIGVWGSAGITFIMKAGDEQILETKTTGSWFHEESSQFSVAKETVLTFEGGNSSHPVDYFLITGEEAKATDQPYKIQYVAGEETIKEIDGGMATVGSAITLTDDQKKGFTEGGVKYLYVKDDASEKTIAGDGSTIITVTMRKAENWKYSVKNNVNDEVKTYEFLEGDGIKVTYNKYILDGGVIYSKGATNKEYRYDVTPTANNQEETLEYSKTSIEDAIFFAEAEDIEGMESNSDGQAGSRSSNGAGGFSSEAVSVYTLQPGKYKVTLAYSGNAGTTFTVKAGEEVVMEGATNGSWTENTCEEFVLNTESTITVQGGNGGSSSKTIDYILISGQEILEANYTLQYVIGEGEDMKVVKPNVIKKGNVGSAIVLSKNDIAPFQTDDATYTYVSDDAEGKIVTIEGTVVTITCKKTQGYVLHFVDKDAEDDHIIKDDVEIPATVGSPIVVSDEHKQSFNCKEHGVMFVYVSDDSEGRTVSEKADIIKVYCQAVKANYTLDYVVDGKSVKKETKTGRVGETIEVTPEDLGEITDADGNSYIFTGEDPETPRIAQDGSTVVTLKYAKVIEVASITLDKTEIETLEVGKSVKLTATVLPADATDPKVTWSSSDESIATVDAEGNVTGVAVGTAIITAKAGDKTATCTVNVDKGATVDAIEGAESVKVYDLNGHYVADEVEGLKAGIYIIRKGNTAKKVIIR